MTPAQLIEHEAAIRQAITGAYVDPTGKALPIYDGVVDPELYLTAPTRILWILKEPWDEDDHSGGGWSLTQLLRDKSSQMARGRTFLPITYITYGLFNRVWMWDEIPDIDAEPEMGLLLRSIAFINAKKLPGPQTGSYNPSIVAAYRRGREVILRQIDTYKPDFIFCSRPHWPYIISDLGLDASTIASNGTAQYINTPDRAFFYVYHPNQRTIGQETYVDEILHIAETRMA